MLAFFTGLIIHFIESTGYFGVFSLMAIGAALIPLPSQITLPFAGYLVSKGLLSYPLVVLVAALGDLIGSLISYSIGYFLEETIIITAIRKHGKYILLTEHDYAKAVRWFNAYGDKFVFISKLFPGLRYLSALPPGVLKMNLKKFAFYTFLGSTIWCALLVYIGVYLGQRWITLAPLLSKFSSLIIIVLVIVALFYIFFRLHQVTYRKNT